MGVILTLPRLGETMEEARVTEWLVAPGQAFLRGDVLLEVETDKTVVEVPALQDGRLLVQLVVAGQMVALGAPIAEVEGDVVAPAPEAAVPVADVDAQRAPSAALPVAGPGLRPAASPAARRLARSAGVDLAQVAGTGRRGRVTGDDVRAAGARATVVFLHGLYDHAGGWRGLPDRLQRLGFPVAVPDLPGHGDSTDAVTDVAQAVQALLSVMPAGRLRLVGHSAGAVLAVRLAHLLGARVEALVLIAPAGLGARINGDFLDRMAGAASPEALAQGLAMLGAGPVSGAVLAGELARLQRRRSGMTALAGAFAGDGRQKIDISRDLALDGIAVTAVFGLDDRIIDWQDCARLPPEVAIHLVPGAGHLPHLQVPALVARLIAGLPAAGGP